MLHENIVLPQASNTLPWEFSTLINLFHTHYARNDDRPFPNQDRTAAGIDSTRQITTSKFKFVGGDKNSRHMIHRILGCTYIVEALYLTRLGLTGGTQPQSTQFCDHGSAYEMWWKDPMALIEFIYVLRCLNIGPVRKPLFKVLSLPTHFPPARCRLYIRPSRNYQAHKERLVINA